VEIADLARGRGKTRKASSAAAPYTAPSAQPEGTPDTPLDSNADPRTPVAERKSHASPEVEETAEHASAPTLDPGLYITSTPIGNAADITLRALTVLRHCDAIVAEDTRVTSRLLALYGISRPLLVYNDHNAAAMRPKLLDRLGRGARLALVSDAGTPLISDPGHKLVREARALGLPVFPVPGPSAVLAALTASGLPSDRFFFAGFLPPKSGERRSALAELKAVQATLVFFESAHRLGDALADMGAVFGPRDAVVARELTKLHEEIIRAPLSELSARYASAPPKGEIVVLVAPASKAAPDTALVDSLLMQALVFMPVKAATALVAEATGSSKRDVYERALALKSGSDDGQA
jgi:16S rRNA (cytidine1402-2'-O)-methyltransferase